MEKKRALYAGTFDPFTNGHLDIVQRAIKIFDEIVVLVAVSPNKKPFMSTEQRVNVLKKLFAHLQMFWHDQEYNVKLSYL